MLVPIVLTILLGLMFSLHELLNSTQPVRHVVRRYGSSYRGYWPSSKGLRGQPVPYESALARDFLLLCEYLPDVVLIIAEPGTITYDLDGVAHKYTPDYLLHMSNGMIVVIEVKYHRQALRNQLRFQALRYFLSGVGALFLVPTEVELREPALLANLTLLEAHRHMELSERTQEIINSWFYRPDVLFPVLVARVGDRHQVVAAIAQGVLACDITMPIDQARLRRA